MSSQPLLVHNRIDRNKRLTRVMLLAFGVAMVLSVSAASVFVCHSSPSSGVVAYAIYGAALSARIQALEPGDMNGLPGLLD